MARRFLRKAAVAERYSICTRTVERMSQDGRLPRPVFRGRFPLWAEDDLDESDRAATRAARSAKTEPTTAQS
jgi:predicted DNA-binding transcriptional regulator AlpA